VHAPLFRHELDYIFFCYGLSFVLLAAVCLGARKSTKPSIPWGLLGLFGLVHGLNEWCDMLAISLGTSVFLSVAKVALTMVSFVFLFEFGWAGLIATGSRFVGSAPHTGVVPAGARRGDDAKLVWIGRSVVCGLVVLAGLGGLSGWAGIDASTRYALGCRPDCSRRQCSSRHGKAWQPRVQSSTPVWGDGGSHWRAGRLACMPLRPA